MPLRKKELFLCKEKVPMATKPGGGGPKALVAGLLRNELFFATFLSRKPLALFFSGTKQ